jgi:NTP pyrophosphatase (non-canonical NTP hydrolase)
MTQIQTGPYTFAELQGLVIDWAAPKQITIESQYLKIIEEVGELAKAINEKNEPEIIDGFGDVAVTLIIANQIVEKKKIAVPTQRIKKATNLYIKGILFGISIADFHEAYAELYSLAKHLGYDLNDCLWAAYNVIKDRKGKTINGNFIKEYDYIKPDHYKNETGYDVIDLWHHFNLDASLGVTIKHLSRLGQKPTDSEIQDLQKSLHYIERDLANLANPKRIPNDLDVRKFSKNPLAGHAIELLLDANTFSLKRDIYLKKVKEIVERILKEATKK